MNKHEAFANKEHKAKVNETVLPHETPTCFIACVILGHGLICPLSIHAGFLSYKYNDLKESKSPEVELSSKVKSKEVELILSQLAETKIDEIVLSHDVRSCSVQHVYSKDVHTWVC